MEFISNRHLTWTLLLAAAFFFLAAAHQPHPSVATDHHPALNLSVLKLPTEAANTVEEEALCCDDCGLCTKSFPPICTCRDVLKECPSWCTLCEDVAGGKRCLNFLPNYCENGCSRRREMCCDECGLCTKSLPPICTCRDVMEECPSWCEQCEDADGGKVCLEWKVNYCEKTCASY